MYLTGYHSKEKYPANTLQWYGNNYEQLNLCFEPLFDIQKISSRPNNMWRYREAIPIPNNAELVSFDEGYTPLSLIKIKNGFEVWIKQEQLFNTGSYKDRGASVLMSHIKQLKVTHVVQDSSGNAGAAITAYAAKANIACDIYLPEDTAAAKILQMQANQANIIKVKGNRKQTAEAAFEAAKTSYYASHSFNPFFFHGTKTFAYEVCEQLNWNAPDTVIVPVGNGTLLLGCAIGFDDLYRAGIIKKIPKLIGVQATNCNPLAQQFHALDLTSQFKQKSTTLAEGIAIENPVRGEEIIKAVKNSGGTFISVSEEEIITAWKEMATIGYFIEPTSAATIAGVNIYTQSCAQKECVVSLFSGNGLKSLDKIDKILNPLKAYN